MTRLNAATKSEGRRKIVLKAGPDLSSKYFVSAVLPRKRGKTRFSRGDLFLLSALTFLFHES